MAIEEENGKFRSSSAAAWLMQNIGIADRGWICPEAPIRQTNPPSGAINSAWTVIRWPEFVTAEGLKLSGLRSSDLLQPKFRASSYALNSWIVHDPSERDPSVESWFYYAFIRGNDLANRAFGTESRITNPANTPLLIDGTIPFVWPLATDAPPKFNKGHVDVWSSPGTMGFIALPRHGNSPSKRELDWSQNTTLPGAVNAIFYDGHCEAIRLKRLWELSWHADYVPPLKTR